MIRGLLLLLLALPATLSAEEAREYLQQMSSAARGLNYAGTFVYLNEGRLQGMRILHDVDAQGLERERITALSGPSLDLIRHDEEVTRIAPQPAEVAGVGGTGDAASAKVTHVAHLPIQPPQSLERFADYYRIELGESEQVAGREALQIRILPRDHERYARHYWVDADSGLLLRAELHNESGRVVEQMMFSELTVFEQPLADELFDNQGMPGVSVSHRRHAAAAAPSPWQVGGLPEGFSLEALHPRAHGDKSKRIEHRVYGDGLASISVFIERDEGGPGWQGASRVGALNAYISRRNGFRIVVLGEVPAETVRRIAESVVRSGDSPS